MLDPKSIKHLVYLLEDDDEQIRTQVKNEILELGYDIIPHLEEELPNALDENHYKSIEELIKQLELSEIKTLLKNWLALEQENLLKGIWIISKLKYYDLSYEELNQKIESLKLEVWLELNDHLTIFEAIYIINYVLFTKHQFKGDTDNFHNVENSFLNIVLEEKTGTPVSLGIIFMVIAQRLNIPIFGVNLPQHFVLGYIQQYKKKYPSLPNEEGLLLNLNQEEVHFYINPFSNGVIFEKESIFGFLKELNINPEPKHFNSCSNYQILLRVIRNIIFALDRRQDLHTKEKYSELLVFMEKEHSKL